MAGFPRPEEVRSAFQESLNPIAEVIRAEVHKVFSTPPDVMGGWSFDPMGPIAGKFKPIPDWKTIKAAFAIVQHELILAGWSAEWRMFRDETSVVIRPRGRGDR